MFGFVDKAFGLSVPFAKYLSLTLLRIVAASFKQATFNFGSYLVLANA